MAGVFPPQGSAAGGLTGVTEDGGSPVNVVTVADALNVGTATDATAAGELAADTVYAPTLDLNGGATGGAAITVANNGGHIYLQAQSGRGVDFRVNGVGTAGAYVRSTGLFPLQQDGSGTLGTTSYPWGALTLGDATAQVELGHGGSSDGRLLISDPNSTANARLDLLNSAGTSTLIITAGSNQRINANVGSLELATINTVRALVTASALTPNTAGGLDLGDASLPFDALTLGDASTQVTLGGGVGVNGRLQVSDPNSTDPGRVDLLTAAGSATAWIQNDSNYLECQGTNGIRFKSGATNYAQITAQTLTIYDSSGNADVSLVETSGRATLSGASGIGLSNGTQFLYWIGNDLYSQTAGAGNLGTATEPWGDAHVAGQGNAASLGIKSSTEVLSALSGASASTTNLVPAGCTVLYVVARVTTLIEGATTFDIGDGSDVDRYGAAIALAAGTTVDETDGTADPRSWSSSAQDVTLTANGSSFTAGAVRITAFYLQPTAPTS